MKQYRDLFFDLDGTLVNTYEGVTRAFTYALKSLGVPLETPAILRKILGPPLEWSFRELFGLEGEENTRAILLFREYYAARGVRECTVYPGIPEVLAALRESGFRISVATSKQEEQARTVLCEKGLTPYFDFIGGADETGAHPRSDKESVLRYCFASLPDADPAQTLMIGDRKHDMIGAAALGIDALGALWGFGSREELLAHGALALAESPQDLPRLISFISSDDFIL